MILKLSGPGRDVLGRASCVNSIPSRVDSMKLLNCHYVTVEIYLLALLDQFSVPANQRVSQEAWLRGSDHDRATMELSAPFADYFRANFSDG